MKISPHTLILIKYRLEDPDIRNRVFIAEYLGQIDPGLYELIIPRDKLYFSSDELFSKLIISLSKTIG